MTFEVTRREPSSFPPSLARLKLTVSRKKKNQTKLSEQPDHSADTNSFPPSRISPHDCQIPRRILSLFTYLAQQGVHTSDLFRRPGNITQMKSILQSLGTGKPVTWSDYNLYTVANVAKKFLLSLPGGLLGPDGEHALLITARKDYSPEPSTNVVVKSDEAPARYLEITTGIPLNFLSWSSNSSESDILHDNQRSHSHVSTCQFQQFAVLSEQRIAIFGRIIRGLPASHKQLAIIMLGILHQMVFRAVAATVPTDSSRSRSQTPPRTRQQQKARVPILTVTEGIVKSVAGTLFHTCTQSVLLVEQTSQVLQSLILCFPALGSSVTQFYLDVVSNRLRSQIPYSPSIGICGLCPNSVADSVHSHNFGVPKSVIWESPRISRTGMMLQAAGRFLCLKSTVEAAVAADSSSQHNHQQLSAQKSLNSIKFRCPFICHNSQASPPHPLSSPVLTNRFQHRKKRQQAVATHPSHSTSLGDTVHQTGARTTIRYGLPTAADTHEGSMENSVYREYIPTLRRQKSRFRSLKRRQMENLARRAEWFLEPTTLPPVNLPLVFSNASCTKIPTSSPLDNNASDISRCHQPPVSTSLSVIELNHPSKQLPVPRLLYTASTGDLERESSFDDRGHVIQDGGPFQPRVSSVTSLVPPLYVRSFMSVHSAPSAADLRFASSSIASGGQMLQYYCHPLNHIAMLPSSDATLDRILPNLTLQHCSPMHNPRILIPGGSELVSRSH